MVSTLALVALVGTAIAAPSRSISQRASSCGQWDSVVTGSYTVYNNLWDESAATSGSQCFSVDSLSGTKLAWSTTWSWEGAANSVKSYANVVVTTTAKQLSAITSITSTWAWKYAGTDVDADVAFDLFTSSTADGSEEYEIMVWLAALGTAGPIASTYDASGNATPVTTCTVGDYEWSLYKGSNGVQTVFSFLPASEIDSFSGDVMDFFDYLVKEQSFDDSQYLVSIGAGTEAFTGTDAVFTVSEFSVAVA